MYFFSFFSCVVGYQGYHHFALQNISYTALENTDCITISKNTWNEYVKSVGQMLGEANERTRQTFKFVNAQVDKMVLG